MALEFGAAVVPQDAVQQVLARLPDGHRRVDGGADAVVVQHEVLVEPLQSRYRVPAAGSGDGSVHILKISRTIFITVAPAYMVYRYKIFLDIRLIFEWSQLEPVLESYMNILLMWAARLYNLFYGQNRGPYKRAQL